VLSTYVSYISMNRPSPGAHWSGLVTGFYTAHYIVGMFVMGILLKPVTHYIGFVTSLHIHRPPLQ
jgi:hypothetical protein